MPQHDRHRTRIVPIEFVANEQMGCLPYNDRITMILISKGNGSIMINDKTWVISAPCLIALSYNDKVNFLDQHNLHAKSFSLNPVFINSQLTFETLSKNEFDQVNEQHDRNLMQLFLNHSDVFSGVIDLPSDVYMRVAEWMNIMGTETLSQSDGMWTCRIRRYLLQTLYLLEDLYLNMRKKDFLIEPTENDYVELAQAFIHIHYQSELSLDTICNVVNLNRTSLNKRFKEKTGTTVIDYLINHRIKIACETLTHTNLKLGEIALACGFVYDTYFIKQFKKKIGISPTEYRQNTYRKRDASIQKG